jgi:hypothetical protein
LRSINFFGLNSSPVSLFDDARSTYVIWVLMPIYPKSKMKPPKLILKWLFPVSPLKCWPDLGAPPIMGGRTMGWLGGAGSLGGGGAFLSEPYCLKPAGGDDAGAGSGLLWMPILGRATDRLLLLFVRRTVLTFAGPAEKTSDFQNHLSNAAKSSYWNLQEVLGRWTPRALCRRASEWACRLFPARIWPCAILRRPSRLFSLWTRSCRGKLCEIRSNLLFEVNTHVCTKRRGSSWPVFSLNFLVMTVRNSVLNMSSSNES